MLNTFVTIKISSAAHTYAMLLDNPCFGIIQNILQINHCYLLINCKESFHYTSAPYKKRTAIKLNTLLSSAQVSLQLQFPLHIRLVKVPEVVWL
jgi:hypothetical protein